MHNIDNIAASCASKNLQVSHLSHTHDALRIENKQSKHNVERTEPPTELIGMHSCTKPHSHLGGFVFLNMRSTATEWYLITAFL
jgi:transcription antitermination factor NusG